MADITASMVKELRERTQAGMSDCKNALVETAGDMEKAVEVILKKGIVKAAARAGRVATEGEVATWLAPDAKRGVMVEVNCQTDFVSRGDDFKDFVRNVLDGHVERAGRRRPRSADVPGRAEDRRAGARGARREDGRELRRPALGLARRPTARTRRRPSCTRTCTRAASSPSSSTPKDPTRAAPSSVDFVDNVAMQMAAMNQRSFARRTSRGRRSTSRTRFSQRSSRRKASLSRRGPRSSTARSAKWFTEVTLLGQDNVWDPAAGTIDKIRHELGKKLGGEVKIHAFLRYSLGEGIEKQARGPRRRSREDGWGLTRRRAPLRGQRRSRRDPELLRDPRLAGACRARAFARVRCRRRSALGAGARPLRSADLLRHRRRPRASRGGGQAHGLRAGPASKSRTIRSITATISFASDETRYFVRSTMARPRLRARPARVHAVSVRPATRSPTRYSTFFASSAWPTTRPSFPAPCIGLPRPPRSG